MEFSGLLLGGARLAVLHQMQHKVCRPLELLLEIGGVVDDLEVLVVLPRLQDPLVQRPGLVHCLVPDRRDVCVCVWVGGWVAFQSSMV